MIRFPERWLPTVAAAVGLLSAVAGIATAHLAGFFVGLEDPIRQAAIARFSTDVLQSATFYALEAALVAKGVTYFLGPSFDTILSRLARGARWTGWLNGVATFLDSVRRRASTPISLVIGAVWFTSRYVGELVLANVDRPVELLDYFVWMTILGLPFIAAEGLSARSLKNAFAARSSDDEARKSRLAMGASIAILLFVSFQLGGIRYERLATIEPVVFQDGKLSGRFNVLATNTTDALLLERFGDSDIGSRHVLRTPRMILYEPAEAAYLGEFEFHWPASYEEIQTTRADERGADVEVRYRHDGEDRVRFYPRAPERVAESTLEPAIEQYPDGPF